MKFWSISILMLASLVSFGQTYFFYDDLSEVESSPGVAIIYPKAIGPEIPDDLEARESNESPTFVTTMPPMSGDNSETTTSSMATTLGATTTDSNTASTTKSTSEAATTGTATSSLSTTTTSTPEKLQVMTASASAPASVYVPRPVAPKPTTHTSPATSRVWHHFNSQPASVASSHRSAWQRVDRDSEAVESNPAPVYAAAKANASARPASVYVRKPVFSNPSSVPAKAITNKNSNAEDDLAVGEFTMNHRDIYYPEINRIQAPNPMPTSTASSVSTTTTSTSSSASASSNSSSSWSSNNEYQASSSNINAAYGTKGISPYLGNTWQPSLPSPVKAIRKVVKSSKTYNDIERNQGLLSSQQPYRVRVVVQPTTKAPIIEQNYYQQKEYLQEQLKEYLADHHQNYNINRVSSASASASAAASASSSDSFNKITQVQTEYSTNALDDHQRKEYVEVTQTKISPPVKSVPPAPIKSVPAPIKSPPAPIKSLPAPKPLPVRPAPIKQVYATKSPPRAALRAPVFEQEYEPPRPQPIIQQQQHLEHENVNNQLNFKYLKN